VHVPRREAVATAGDFRAHVGGAAARLVGRGGGAGRVRGIEAGLLLIAGVDAGPLHEVAEGFEGEGLVDGLHLVEELDRVEGGPGHAHAALVTAQPVEKERKFTTGIKCNLMFLELE